MRELEIALKSIEDVKKLFKQLHHIRALCK